MSIFKTEELPSCVNCMYATEFIPLFTYPYSDPYCKKEHGKCDIDKICEDYLPRTTCNHCKHFKECNTNWNSYVCDNYIEKEKTW